jgi:hypothetical protein
MFTQGTPLENTMHCSHKVFLQIVSLFTLTGTLFAQAPSAEKTTLRNDGIEAQFSRHGNALHGARIINRATGYDWLKHGTPAGVFLVQGETKIAGFDDDTGLVFQNRQRSANKQGGQDDVMTWKRADGLAVNWTARSFAKTSTVEFRAILRNRGSKVIPELREFGPLALSLRGGDEKIRVHWVRRDSYKKHEMLLKESFSVSGGSWNAPAVAGWVAIENVDKREILFVGIEWESYWRIALTREQSILKLECTLERFTRNLKPGESFPSPRVFLGVSHGSLDDSLRDLHDYLREYVLPPVLPNFPWVTYNIWGTAGDGSDETAILAEIPFVADLGVELFYVDASWYEGSCKVPGLGDWFTGLGNWHSEDFKKYPRGLAHISEKVHEAGMKFGLWFAPQMVDTDLIGGRIPESWIAQRDGKNLVTNAGKANGWGSISQVCLGNPEVAEFLKKSIGGAVKRYGLDWVKWDGSGLPGPSCNRAGHGHDPDDGHLAAIRAQYDVWNYLHTQFPNLVLEECGYGNRLDYGLARYMRTNWLDDSSSDARPVRRRLINGSYIYPAPYLETWVYKSNEIDTEKDPSLLDTTIRSRMLGLFGVGCRVGAKHHERLSYFPKEAVESIRRNVVSYKEYRHLLHEDVYHLPPPPDNPTLGDAIQFCRRDGTESVVMVFQDGSAYANPNAAPFDDSDLTDVVHQKNIKATSGSSLWGFIAQGAVNGKGLNADNGRTHNGTLTDMWLSSRSGGMENPHPGIGPAPNWIAFEFDKVYELGKTWIWNWNAENTTGIGLNNVTVLYSETGGADATEWKNLGDAQIQQATGTPHDPGSPGPDFGGVKAKYVVLSAKPMGSDMKTSGSWGRSEFGLAEIRFYLNTDEASQAVQRAAAKSATSNQGPQLKRTVVLSGLDADASYEVKSYNTKKSHMVRGAHLMSAGLSTAFEKPGMSEIYLLRRK